MRLFIEHLDYYPQTGEHLKVVGHGLPFCITKGEDTWYYIDSKGKEKEARRHLWHAYGEHVKPRGFKNWRPALEYAVKEYRKWLKGQQKTCDEVLAFEDVYSEIEGVE